MQYIQLDGDGRVIAWTESDGNPDPEVWLESPWESVPDGFDDWLYLDGELAYSPRNLPPEPYSAAEAVAIMLRGGVTDAEAVRLKPYIPAFDAARAYSEGDLAVRYGKVSRCTAYGWRELG